MLDFLFSLLAASTLLLFESAAADPAVHGPSNRVLDTAYIHKIYINGDFDKAIHMLEIALKYDGDFSHGDSVFAFKHLGVMYAAKYETREQGKLYMMKLLQTEPTAKIMDMYASDMIYMIFKNVQDEFHFAHKKLARAQGHVDGNTRTAPADSSKPGGNPAPRRHKSHAWAYLTAGGLAAAGGVVLFMHFTDEAKTSPRERTIPP